MDDDFNFEERCIRLDYYSDAVPQIHCPKTLLPIFPAMTPDGMFLNGQPHPQDTFIDYSKIPSVLFAVYTGLDECNYYRKDVQAAIENAREALKAELQAEDDDFDEEIFDYDHDNDFEILQDHVKEMTSPCIILHIVLDRDPQSSQYVGIDLS